MGHQAPTRHLTRPRRPEVSRSRQDAAFTTPLRQPELLKTNMTPVGDTPSIFLVGDKRKTPVSFVSLPGLLNVETLVPVGR